MLVLCVSCNKIMLSSLIFVFKLIIFSECVFVESARVCENDVKRKLNFQLIQHNTTIHKIVKTVQKI